MLLQVKPHKKEHRISSLENGTENHKLEKKNRRRGNREVQEFLENASFHRSVAEFFDHMCACPHVSDAELLFEDVDSLISRGILSAPSIGRIDGLSNEPFGDDDDPRLCWPSFAAKTVAVFRSANFFLSAAISSFRRRFALALRRKRTAHRCSSDAC